MSSPLLSALARLEELGNCSDSADYLVRTFLSPANKLAAEKICGWMEELGMEIEHAADGTVRGVLPGGNPAASPLLLGSHYDTVIDAGKYDGALGIILALAALETLRDERVTLDFPIHLLAFSDEEGTRFQTTYLGSKSITAPLDAGTLATRDSSGTTLADALAADGWHQGAHEIRYATGSCRGYVEVHIEQGRVLESAGEPAAAVSGIAGQTRLKVTLHGQADHAGTTPMALRRDALAGAAACILAAESMATSHPPLVITVGKLQVHPGVSNSIPQTAEFTIDLRHPEDISRREFLDTLHQTCSEIAGARQLELSWTLVQDNDATPCDPPLTEGLLDALQWVTGSRLMLASGAGHDGVAIAEICPIAMLFLRCRHGLSHHPDEFTSPEDIATGIAVLTRFLKFLPA